MDELSTYLFPVYLSCEITDSVVTQPERLKTTSNNRNIFIYPLAKSCFFVNSDIITVDNRSLPAPATNPVGVVVAARLDRLSLLDGDGGEFLGARSPPSEEIQAKKPSRTSSRANSISDSNSANTSAGRASASARIRRCDGQRLVVVSGVSGASGVAGGGIFPEVGANTMRNEVFSSETAC
jgi:hypothetical protein